MRWPLLVLSLMIVSCTSTGSGSRSDDVPSYDGTADTMDSLPDCGPDLVGSIFWVRSAKAAFDCTQSGEWRGRKSAKGPQEESEGEPEPWNPRMIEK